MFRRVGSFAKKALGTITKPIGKLLKPFTKVLGGILNKLPFGNVIKGFIGKFLQNPLSLLAGPVLGPLAGIIGGAAGIGGLLKLGGLLGGSPAFQNPMGRNNAMHMMAHRHAQIHFQNRC